MLNNVAEFRAKMMVIVRLDSVVTTTGNVGLGYAWRMKVELETRLQSSSLYVLFF